MTNRNVKKNNIKNKNTTKKNSMYKMVVYKPEVKINEISVNGETGSVTGRFHLLNAVQAGSLHNCRIGKQITVRSIQMALYIYNNSPSVTRGRLIIIQDRNPDGTQLTLGDVYDETTLTFLTGALRNLNNRHRFKIYMDRKYILSSTDNDNAGSGKLINIFKKVNFRTNYNDTSSTLINSIEHNAIYFIWASESGSNLLTGTIRTRYIDM